MQKGRNFFMARNEDNTVSSKNQVSISQSVCFEDRGGKRILFLGNSITKHAPAENIGWFNDWGMAASSEDKDYVHRTMAKVWEISPNTSFMIAQIAQWEREYWNENLMNEQYSAVIDFKADIIIMRAIENVRGLDHNGYSFEDGYKALINKLAKKDAKVVLTNSFWEETQKNEIVKKIASEQNYKLVDVCIGADDRYTAKGLFEHSGVASHPGDEGMEEIASRIFEEIKEFI